LPPAFRAFGSPKSLGAGSFFMSEELSYVLVTPHSIRKSRTGAILSRLISRTALDLVAARMFAPSRELVDAFADSLVTTEESAHRDIQDLLKGYVLKNFAPTQGHHPRVLMLVLKGENAVEKIRTTVATFSTGTPRDRQSGTRLVIMSPMLLARSRILSPPLWLRSARKAPGVTCSSGQAIRRRKVAFWIPPSTFQLGHRLKRPWF